MNKHTALSSAVDIVKACGTGGVELDHVFTLEALYKKLVELGEDADAD